MHLTRRTLPAAVALLAACAGGSAPQGPAPSADLPALEAASQQRPRDAGLMTQLGIANYEAQKYERARDVLASALTLNRQNYAAQVYLGLTYEQLGKFDSARVAYTAAALRPGMLASAARSRTGSRCSPGPSSGRRRATQWPARPRSPASRPRRMPSRCFPSASSAPTRSWSPSAAA